MTYPVKEWNDIKVLLHNAVFGPENRRITRALVDLRDENAKLNEGATTFSYKGQPCLWLDRVLFPGKKKPLIVRKPIHDSLKERLDATMRSADIYLTNQARFTNFLATTRCRIDTDQDIRDALPDVVFKHFDLAHISGLVRTREAGYCFLHPSGQGKLKIYEDFERVVYHYLANELVF